MFSYMNCYDQVIYNTLTPEKICYTCGVLCELGLFVFSLMFVLCCLTTCCHTKKKSKEIIIDTELPPPYS